MIMCSLLEHMVDFWVFASRLLLSAKIRSKMVHRRYYRYLLHLSMDFNIYVSNVFVLITTMGLFFIQSIENSLADIPSDAATKSVSNELMQ